MNLPNRISRRSSQYGQATLEYTAAAVMVTGSIAVYPLMMNALGTYLRSMYFILTMAMP